MQLTVDQLAAAREKTLAELEEARQRLSSIEDHSRRIMKQIEDLQAAAKQFPDATGTVSREQDALRAELLRLNTERMRLGTALNNDIASAFYRKTAFAVIPFDGIHRTHRRPIYLECRSDSIILQPEGIVFTPADFMGPSGPGNPLASALRAAREYWSQQPPPSADIPNEPYPLLLVRPDGIIGYYLAREAMASWDAEFGYELVDGDWKLDFPLTPQPQLKEMEERAVTEARQRLQWLAQASPERFERKSKAQYRLSAIRGGLVRDGGPSLGNDPFANDPLGGFGRSAMDSGYRGQEGAGQGASGGNSISPQGTGDGRSLAAGGGNAVSPRGNNALGNYGMGGGSGFGRSDNINNELAGDGGEFRGAGSGRYSDNPRGGGNGFGQGGYEFNGSSGKGNGNQAQIGTNHLSGNSAGNFNNAASNQAGNSFNGQNSTGRSGDPSQHSGLSQNGSSTNANPSYSGANSVANGDASQYGGVQGQAGSSASASGSPGTNASGSPSGTAASSMGQASGGDSSSLSAGTPSPSLQLNQSQPTQRTASHSMADIRGRNWALPSSSNASVPITRPIRLECWPDRIVIMPDSRDQQPQVIPLTSHTEESIDQVVAAVREQTRGWGIAGRGMYWKPQLTLDVNPNGEGRAQDLQVLLANSGMDVKRR